ncbi:MAG: GntR family transcriptional regulator [Cellvibrionaceae bacterium]|nr:GntR family transcriptional regulator [Cellvibrionaceae bacterium]
MGPEMYKTSGEANRTGEIQSGRLYQRVAEQLAEVIASGEYPVGSRLPAERKLAERFNVSRPTVREAIIALELAGCVEVKGGSGVYVTSGRSGGAGGNRNGYRRI